MATVAYVDHSFHRKTLSTEFIPDILRRRGHEVNFFWDDSWRGGKPVLWSDIAHHDVIIFFQAFSPILESSYRELHPNVIFIPMLDQFGIWQGPLFNLTTFWSKFQGSKTLNFSHAAHAISVGSGVASFYCKYYQEPPEAPGCMKTGLHGFFWQRRTDQISWSTIKKLIGDTEFTSFHIHNVPDPGSPPCELPSDEDVKRYNISVSDWFEKKEDFIRTIERANVFFCPRAEEGIGQAFLEALARGQLVVAPNHGTMNEYIQSGLNGLLFDITDPQPVPFADITAIQAAALKSAKVGWDEWRSLEDQLVKYILEPSPSVYLGKYVHNTDHSSASNGITALLRYVARRFPAIRPAASLISRTTRRRY